MSVDKELAETWFDCQTEIKQLKAVLSRQKDYILTLKDYIQFLETNKPKRDCKRFPDPPPSIKQDKTLMYDHKVGDINLLCAKCENTEIKISTSHMPSLRELGPFPKQWRTFRDTNMPNQWFESPITCCSHTCTCISISR